MIIDVYDILDLAMEFSVNIMRTRKHLFIRHQAANYKQLNIYGRDIFLHIEKSNKTDDVDEFLSNLESALEETYKAIDLIDKLRQKNFIDREMDIKFIKSYEKIKAKLSSTIEEVKAKQTN